MSKTYKKGPYSVTISDTGEIKVKPDDWLSKYSYAMFGNYTTIQDFVRPGPEPTGWKEIVNKDLIYAGETLLYKPVFEDGRRRKKGSPAVPPAVPKPVEPGEPADVKSSTWYAASLGSLDIVMGVGVFGLAMRNAESSDVFYYAAYRAGYGAADPYSFGRLVGKLLRSLGRRIFLGKEPYKKWVPMFELEPFSANDIDFTNLACIGWNYSNGMPGENESFEKIAIMDGFDTVARVRFEKTVWWTPPGASAHLSNGFLVRVW